MKIRQGFVSNSSSSSFIVRFKSVPQSVEDTQQMLFGDQPEDALFADKFPLRQIAEVVFRDIQNQEPKKERELEALEMIQDEFPNSKIMENLKPGEEIFIFNYSDNDGSMFSAMEHCDLFELLPHLQSYRH